MKLVNSLVMVALIGLCGCNTWMRAYVAVHDAADEVLTSKTNALPAVIPPVVVAPPVADPAPIAVDISGEVIDPIGYMEASVAANAHYEECHIEPATGLMVRVPVWRPSAGNWWMLSSLFEGQVKRDGSELVCNNFVKNGMAVEVMGFCDYELHGDTPDTVRYIVKGNRCPYTGERRYIVSRVHKAK